AAAGRKGTSAKQWPLAYFTAWVKLFKERYPHVQVVQVGGADTERIVGADYYLLGRDIELVKYVLRGAVFHLDIEGGLVHLATQLGTRCVVLFGPTPLRIFAYEQNINIVTGPCHDCWFLYGEAFACARHMEKPICMYAITPDMVMKKIQDEFASI
ncbi:MAG: glycosyltransferase family 9 protein, partial [Selenomonadaceae bacterium]|nr:glycosyltransferase family 9 protein [Selenomonadaceae bacterium]